MNGDVHVFFHVSAQSHDGVFGAGATGEGNFSQYERRDIELDPVAPISAVLTVAYIPPQECNSTRGGRGGGLRPRVTCFLADGHAQSPPYASASFVDDWDGQPPVWMECMRSHCGTRRAPCGAGGGTGDGTKPPYRRSAGTRETSLSDDNGSVDSDVCRRTVLSRENDDADGDHRPRKVSARSRSWDAADMVVSPKRREDAAADDTEAHAFGTLPRRTPRLTGGGGKMGPGSSLRRHRCVLPKLSPPSSAVPLDDADVFLLVGTHQDLLQKTSAWLESSVPGAVILGGVSGCALVVGDQVRCTMCR